MEKIKKYKVIASEILDAMAKEYNTPEDPVEYIAIKDENRGSYLLFSDGWVEDDRFYGCYVHIDVAANGKVWVRHDGTEDVVVDKLLDKGVPASDIVIGWHAPYERQYTEFAEA